YRHVLRTRRETDNHPEGCCADRETYLWTCHHARLVGASDSSLPRWVAAEIAAAELPEHQPALWGWRNDVIWATWVAAGAGNIFGILLIVLGLIEVLRGDFVGGIWLALIGLFLRGAASASYEQTLARQILSGQPVSRFMNRQPIAV